MKDFPSKRQLQRLIYLPLLLVLITTSYLIYAPGLSGPFLFDDRDNFLTNEHLKIDSLSAKSIADSATSGHAGPLKRPVAMVSFALNYFYSGGVFDAYDIKLTNVVLHGINGLLVFVLLQLVLRKFLMNDPRRDSTRNPFTSADSVAFVLVLAWLAHPIQLTSVLYSVQRMASLAASFMLVSLIGYIWFRDAVLAGHRGKTAGGLGIFIVAAILGIFTKENAVLIPVLVLLLETMLYSGVPPWDRWQRLESVSRKKLIAATALFLFILILAAILYVLPGYGNRPFTLTERVLTESRVLFFYISLILVPLNSRLGLHHDDLVLSTGLFSPWTTIVSVTGLILLTVLAVQYRKKYPLASFGFLWFLAAHGLESTIFPLEIAHEHRNYLASLGILFVLLQPLLLVGRKIGRTVPIVAILIFTTWSAATTFTRSTTWSSPTSLFAAEATNHPESAIANLEWAGVLTLMKKYDAAQEAYRTAAALNKQEPSHLMWLQILRDQRGLELSSSTNNEIISRIRNYKISPTTISTVSSAVDCLADRCKNLGPFVLQWIDAILAKQPGKKKKSYLKYLLGLYYTQNGELQKAIDSYTDSYNIDKDNVSGLVSLAKIFISIGQESASRHVYSILEEKQQSIGRPNTKVMFELKTGIEKLTHTRKPD